VIAPHVSYSLVFHSPVPAPNGDTHSGVPNQGMDNNIINTLLCTN
jgi:hypothetical protein